MGQGWEDIRRGRAVQVPTTAPYDCRHSFCSLLIHEGRSPLLVADAMGHVSGEMIWRRYAHVFSAAKAAPQVPIADAATSARRALVAEGVRSECDGPRLRVLAGGVSAA